MAAASGCRLCALGALLSHGHGEANTGVGSQRNMDLAQLRSLDNLMRMEAQNCLCTHVEAVEFLEQAIMHREPRLRTKAAEALLFVSDLPENLALRLYCRIWDAIQDNLVRKAETRPSHLGEIGLDDTDGWVLLETLMVAFHRLLQAALQGRMIVLASQMLRPESQHALILQMATHQSRYIREVTFTSLTALVESPACIAALDGIDDAIGRHFAGMLVFVMHVGLQDVFPQVRVAASKFVSSLVHQLDPHLCALLVPCGAHLSLSSCYHLPVETVGEVVNRPFPGDPVEDLQALLPPFQAAPAPISQGDMGMFFRCVARSVAEHWATLLPRLSLNRYHPAESVQALARATFANDQYTSLYTRTYRAVFECPDSEMLAAAAALVCAVDYFVLSTCHGNHTIVEAATYALAHLANLLANVACESVVVRGCPRIEAGSLCVRRCVQRVFACMRDERWPVADTAVLAITPLLQLLDKTPNCIFVDVMSEELLREIVDQLFALLTSSVVPLRAHALNALLTVLRLADGPLAAVEQVDEGLQKFMQSHLLASAAVPRPTVKSFLPASLLNKLPMPMPGTVVVGNCMMTVMPNAVPGIDNTVQRVTPMVRTKGWDCCIDCAVQRSATRGELSTTSATMLCELLNGGGGSTAVYRIDKMLLGMRCFVVDGEVRRVDSLVEAAALLLSEEGDESHKEVKDVFYALVPELAMKELANGATLADITMTRLVETLRRDLEVAYRVQSAATQLIPRKPQASGATTAVVRRVRSAAERERPVRLRDCAGRLLAALRGRSGFETAESTLEALLVLEASRG